jgi:WD40 repeat protein
VTGSVNGQIYLWKESSKPLKAHDSKVTSLIYQKEVLYSAGLDGKVCTWYFKEGLLVKDKTILDVATQLNPKMAENKGFFGIISMDISRDNLLIATKSAAIFEVVISSLGGGQL